MATPTTTSGTPSDIISHIAQELETLKKSASVTDFPIYDALISKFKSLGTGSSTVSSLFQSLTKTIGAAAPVITEAGKAAADAALGVDKITESLVSASSQTQTFANEWEKFQKLKDAPSINIPGLDKLAPVEAFLQKFANIMDLPLKLQRRTLEMGASVGGLSSLFNSGKISIENLNNVSQKMGLVQTSLMKSLNSTEQESKNLFEGFMKIPGAFEKFTKGGAGAVEVTNDMQTVFRMGKASGQDYAVLLTDMADATKNLGLNASQSMDYIGRVTQISTRLKAPAEEVRSYMKNVTDSLSKWGNTTEGTSKIFANLYPVFQKVGVSARDATSIIQQMALSVGNLSVAQEALISARTGGPGGLMGAYQLEEMVAKGDTAGVLKKMQDALKEQMGGKIVTRAEAATSQEAADQYTKQMQLMQSGIFGEYGKDKATANKILDMMAQGGDITEDSLGDVKKSIEDTAKDGLELQKQTNIGLSEILGTVQEIAINQAYDRYKKEGLKFSEYSSKPEGLLARLRAESESEMKKIATTNASSPYKPTEKEDVTKKFQKVLENMFGKINEKGERTPTPAEMAKTKADEEARRAASAASSPPTSSAPATGMRAGSQPPGNTILPPFQVNITMPPCPHCGQDTTPHTHTVNPYSR